MGAGVRRSCFVLSFAARGREEVEDSGLPEPCGTSNALCAFCPLAPHSCASPSLLCAGFWCFECVCSWQCWKGACNGPEMGSAKDGGVPVLSGWEQPQCPAPRAGVSPGLELGTTLTLGSIGSSCPAFPCSGSSGSTTVPTFSLGCPSLLQQNPFVVVSSGRLNPLPALLLHCSLILLWPTLSGPGEQKWN